MPPSPPPTRHRCDSVHTLNPKKAIGVGERGECRKKMAIFYSDLNFIRTEMEEGTLTTAGEPERVRRYRYHRTVGGVASETTHRNTSEHIIRACWCPRSSVRSQELLRKRATGRIPRLRRNGRIRRRMPPPRVAGSGRHRWCSRRRPRWQAEKRPIPYRTLLPVSSHPSPPRRRRRGSSRRTYLGRPGPRRRPGPPRRPAWKREAAAAAPSSRASPPVVAPAPPPPPAARPTCLRRSSGAVPHSFAASDAASPAVPDPSPRPPGPRR
mmetsp:Transcript_3506/g.7240  ORF Transcript_3506/g.7240 Transcript_3506/m.7240 type:complete len:267 (-) Transcript_3506:300-1100(-)